LYNAECSTCHDPYPHRNEFGEAFRLNGYVWPGNKPAEGTIKNPALWRVGLLDTLPLSVSLVQTLDYDMDREDSKLSPTTDLFLHAGGSIKDLVGFFAHDLTSNGGEALAVFRLKESVPALPVPVNVRYGRLVPETTLWKPDQTFTLSPQATQGISVAGEAALGTARDAAEVDTILGSRLFAAAGVSDRANQNQMEYYGRVALKVGGTDLRGNEPDLDLEKASVWDYLTFTLGTYGYFGNTELTGNKYRRLGGDGLLQYKGFSLLLSGLGAHDSDADGTGLEVDSVIFLAEADYSFSPHYLVAARYEHEHIGNSATGISRRAIADLAWTPVENLSFKLEGRQVRTEDPDEPMDTTGTLQISYSM
jgi:hypothetical protein